MVNYSWHIFVSEFGELVEQRSLTVRFYLRIVLKLFVSLFEWRFGSFPMFTNMSMFRELKVAIDRSIDRSSHLNTRTEKVNCMLVKL